MVPGTGKVAGYHPGDSDHVALFFLDVRFLVWLVRSSSADKVSRIDDIEDNSPLRRGMPSAHTLFGVGQTINAANLMMFKSLKLAASLSPDAVRICTDKVIDEHIGQGIELLWTFQTQVPSEEDYFRMVDGSKLAPHPSFSPQLLC